jgi:hypothetical protein
MSATSGVPSDAVRAAPDLKRDDNSTESHRALEFNFNSLLIVSEWFKPALESVEGVSDDMQAAVEIEVAPLDTSPGFVVRTL